MDYFTCDGSWWLPGNLDRGVAGVLTFAADGLTLQVHGSLTPAKLVSDVDGLLTESAPDWDTIAVVYGRARDGRKFTLFEVGGANMTGPYVEQSVYRPSIAVEKVHVDANVFEEAWFEYDALNVWAEPPSLTTHFAEQGHVQVRSI